MVLLLRNYLCAVQIKLRYVDRSLPDVEDAFQIDCLDYFGWPSLVFEIVYLKASLASLYCGRLKIGKENTICSCVRVRKQTCCGFTSWGSRRSSSLLLLLLLHLLLLRMWRVGVGRVGVRVHRRANRARLAVHSAIVLLATGVVRLPHVGTTLVRATGATPALRAGPWRGPRGAGHGLFDVTVCIWTTIWHHILEPHPLLLLHVA